MRPVARYSIDYGSGSNPATFGLCGGRSEPRGHEGRNGGRPAKMDARKISMARRSWRTRTPALPMSAIPSVYPAQRCIGTLKKLRVNES
jgi:hypothetical protein